jgi:cytidylate kinase
MIIAVDGPAASGKGTIARALASHFGLPHMDTGLLYRATAWNLLEMGGDPDSEFAAARATDLSQIDFGNAELKSETVGGIASRISAYPHVREALLERQKRFAAQAGGAVLDGRDIGTVIAPEAGVKLFVTARPEVRAQRRYAEPTSAPATNATPAATPRLWSWRRTRSCSTPATWTWTRPSPPPSPPRRGPRLYRAQVTDLEGTSLFFVTPAKAGVQLLVLLNH